MLTILLMILTTTTNNNYNYNNNTKITASYTARKEIARQIMELALFWLSIWYLFIRPCNIFPIHSEVIFMYIYYIYIYIYIYI
jgi:hypothetical protein